MKPRPTRISSVVLLALLIFGRHSAAQNPGGSQSPGTSPGSGPYKAVMEMEAGLPDHTIYRPEDLSALNGTKLPIVVWGNGACVNVGNAFSNFLTDISSYGYFVIALGPIVQRDTGRSRATSSPGRRRSRPRALTLASPLAVYRRQQLIHPR